MAYYYFKDAKNSWLTGQARGKRETPGTEESAKEVKLMGGFFKHAFQDAEEYVESGEADLRGKQEI